MLFRSKQLGLSRGDREDKGDRKSSKSNISSAPVSSSSSMMSSRPNGSSGSITLSPSEVEMAMLAEPDLPREKALEAYARNKQALIREGKLH